MSEYIKMNDGLIYNYQKNIIDEKDKEIERLNNRIDKAIEELEKLKNLYDDNYTISDKASDILEILKGEDK